MSLMSNVTRQVKHPPTCTTINHSQGKKCFFLFFQKCKDMLCIYVIQFGWQQFIW